MNDSEILLDTPRLLLRHVTIDDAAAFFAYASDDEVGRNAGWRPHESIEETKNIINNYFLGKDLAFGIILKESGKFIGTIGLTQNPLRIIKGSLELGYSLNKDYWNQGIMTEAVNAIIDYGFNAANLEDITVSCYPHNASSRRVILKCGFNFQVTLQKAETRYDGAVMDMECFQMTRKEWEWKKQHEKQ